MGQRMADTDWSKSALGPVSGWSQSLKTAVRIMLTSRQAMFVWWGPQLVNLYNDAYRSIVGGKHPGALGQPASIVWKEIWSEVGPRAQSAMTSNEGTYDEALRLIMERNGYPEETYYTFSYSPVPDDDGRTAGIICANTDETHKIISSRQLALLRDLAAAMGDARTVSDALGLSATSLEGAPDIPFCLIYLQGEHAGGLVLASATGLTDPSVAPGSLLLDGSNPWPILEALRSNAVQVSGSLAGLHMETQPDGRLITQVAVAPIRPSGGTGRPGVMVMGLNPLRLFDALYRQFVELLGNQLSAGIGNALAYEKERERAEALTELDRAKTAFFSNVSHEFRTPLTLMLGPTEDALGSPSRALAGEALETVYRNQLRLMKLVNMLLDFSRIEAGRARARYALTDIAASTAGLAGMFRSAVERAGIEFKLNFQGDLASVYVDREMWEKIVLNLLSNAFKFTFEGYIEVALQAQEQGVELVVKDTGVGMAPADLARIFERFHRVEGARSRSFEGSGIGLALVKDLVELHGGSIRVESEPGRGSAFYVTLRRGLDHLPAEHIEHDATADSGPTNHAHSTLLDAATWGRQADAPPNENAPHDVNSEQRTERIARILVADDNADMRDYIKRVLEPRFDVQVVADGRAALEMARARRPDLLLSDVMMPNLDGFGLLQAIRADVQLRSLPVILLSARAGGESRLEGLEAGADDYLIKPFAARELVARVESVVELNRLRIKLEAERRAFERLFAEAPIPIVVFRGETLEVSLVNSAYREAIGGVDLHGQPFGLALPELEGQGFEELVRSVLQSGQALKAEELPVRLNRDGEGYTRDSYWTIVFAPLRGDLEETRSVVAICTDVTQQVHARRELQRLAEEADAANRAKDEFLAMLGHELRNPLAPIRTALELVRLKGHQMREFAVIERQVSHLQRLVDDLLDVSRIKQGKIGLKRQDLDVAAIVARAVEIASPILETSRCHLSIDVPGDVYAVHADLDRMAQVVSNLLANSAKYSAPGGNVEVRVTGDENQIQLVVQDDGVGIEPSMLNRIFDLFAQQHQTLERSQGGLGLGLAIARSLVAMHGGHVRAESKGVGHGATFTIELPRVAWGNFGDPVPQSEEAIARLSKRRRVLIVDDNEDAAEMLAIGLSQLGYEVRVAHDGPKALALIKDYDVQYALLDIGLPVMDGYELARQLRSTKGKRVGLVAVTGYGEQASRNQTADAGFDRHLVKPVTIEQVHRAINDVEALKSSE
jgi:signal transduction histidine kinase